jgi:Sulfotransferase family
VTSHVVIVAGFHRSGTSVVARLLHSTGLYLGDDLIGALPSNQYGHFEDREFVRLHDRILDDNGVNWQHDHRLTPLITPQRWAEMEELARVRSSQHDLWGFKDPRVCLFLDAWKRVLPEARVVAVYRNWSDSTYSLERRHIDEMTAGVGSDEVHERFWTVPDLGLRMWVEYNRAILRFAADHPDDVVFIPFRALAEPQLVIDKLNERWGMGLGPMPNAALFDTDVTESRPGPQPLADHRLAATLRETWAQLEDRTDGAALSDPPDFAFHTPTETDLSGMSYDRLALENPALRRNLEQARQDLAATRKVVRRLQSEASEHRVELEKARLAEGDLKWLVNRLASSSAGWILRRWRGWRTMEARWRTKG